MSQHSVSLLQQVWLWLGISRSQQNFPYCDRERQDQRFPGRGIRDRVLAMTKEVYVVIEKKNDVVT